jgi:hypothetical protein
VRSETVSKLLRSVKCRLSTGNYVSKHDSTQSSVGTVSDRNIVRRSREVNAVHHAVTRASQTGIFR